MPDDPWTITEPTMIDEGITAKPTRTGFISVRLHYSADPEHFTPDVIASEKARLPGWKWRKEYEIDANAQAGMPVFDPEWLDVQYKSVREPVWRMDLDERGELVRRDRGRLRVFVPPDSQPADLPSNIECVARSCGIGMDVGEGVSKSDSTIQVMFADIREQAAEFACNRIRPSEFGRMAVAVAKYYNDALICCVRKMHGLTVLRTMADELGYPYLWHARAAARVVERHSHMLGWRRGEMSDEYLVGPLIDGLQHGRFLLRGLTTVSQLGQYVYDERGSVVHQQLVDVPAQERHRHGDLVVALCLAERACRDLPLWRKEKRARKRPALELMEREWAEKRNRVWRRVEN